MNLHDLRLRWKIERVRDHFYPEVTVIWDGTHLYCKAWYFAYDTAYEFKDVFPTVWIDENPSENLIIEIEADLKRFQSPLGNNFRSARLPHLYH